MLLSLKAQSLHILAVLNVVEILKILCIPHCFTYLIIIKFVGILIFLNRVMYTRGYPSELISYTLENVSSFMLLSALSQKFP